MTLTISLQLFQMVSLSLVSLRLDLNLCDPSMSLRLTSLSLTRMDVVGVITWYRMTLLDMVMMYKRRVLWI